MNTMQKENKFKVIGIDRNFGYRTIFIIILFTIGMFIATLFTTTLSEIIIIMIIYFIFLLILLYTSYHSFQEKSFEIDNDGIRYLYKDQKKKEIKWKEIEKVISYAQSKYTFFISIKCKDNKD